MANLTSHERILTTLRFEEPDRIGKTDGFWEDTLSTWQAQGMPAGVTPGDFFDFDFDWLYMDTSLRLPEKLLEDSDDFTIREDKHGFVAKQWKGRSGALGYLDHTVKTRDDWDRLRHRMAVDFGDAARINTISYFAPFERWPGWQDMAETYRQLRLREKYVLLMVYGPHEANWRKHGFEATLMDYVLDPGFMADMSRAHVDLIIETLNVAQSYGIKPDGILFAEDLGINTGLMFSPQVYDQVLFPEHRRLGDYLHATDIHYFIHTDGDVRKLIPRLIDAGVQVLQPMEAKAGLDVRKLKLEYGDHLSFMGNIDVQKMSGTKEEMEVEIRSKLEIAKKGGGYIYHSDHSVPPTVDYEQYLYLLQLLNRYGSYT